MNAAILSIGNELLEGFVINTNATFFSSELHKLGIKVDTHLGVNDTKEAIIKGITELFKHHDLIIVSGGLGPTGDDITKQAIAQAFNLTLTINNKALNKLKHYFKQRNIDYSSTNDTQALFSNIDTILENHIGTADGYYFTIDKKTVCVLPGPPIENRPIFREFSKTLTKIKVYEKCLYFIKIGESSAETKISSLYNKFPNVYIGTYMQTYGIKYRLSSSDLQILEQCNNEIKNILFDYYLSDFEDPLEDLVFTLINKSYTISFAESCTAGLAVATLANIAGSSKILNESLVTYANEAKIKYLNVAQATLEKDGAVSQSCVKEMVLGLSKLTNANVCISISGIAGPGGGSVTKPVGLVHFGIKINNDVFLYEQVFSGDRLQVRTRACHYILYETLRLLKCMT